MSRYVSTIGVDFGVKEIALDTQRPHYKVNFFDLSGHPDFFEVRNEFYKDSQGVWQCVLFFLSSFSARLCVLSSSVS